MGNMLLEGNLDPDSILRNPGLLSPCVAFFQRPLHLPLPSQCLPYSFGSSPASSPPPGGRAPGRSQNPVPGAGHPAALPAGQSCRGGGRADGCQGQCLRWAEAEGGQGNPREGDTFGLFWLYHVACGILVPRIRDQTRAPCSGSEQS